MNKNLIGIPFDSTLETSGRLKTLLADLMKTAMILFATVLISEALYFLGLGSQIIIMIYILAVTIISIITSGYGCGILATFLSVFVYDLLITEPRMGFSFTIGFPITLFSMLLIVFSTSALTAQMKTQARIALDRENRALLLYEINQKLLMARDINTIVKLTNEYLIGHIHRPVVFFTKDPSLPDSAVFAESDSEVGWKDFFNSATEREKAHRIYLNPSSAHVSGKFTDVYYSPIVSKDKVLGLIGVYCAEAPLSQPGILFIKMMAGQVALALGLQYLSDKQNNILMESEREKTRSILLRAISHDLRTPLTSILGASSTILEQKNTLDSELVNKLILDIKENAQWLIRIVENLLSITKISQEDMKLNKTLEAAEEVVAQSVSIIRKQFPDAYIHVRSPEDLLLVPMEATLISQVIINLLENSINNSAPGSLILFDVKNNGDYAEFSVSDTGQGIPDQLLGNLFEAPTAEKEQAVDSVRGMGIGLSICKTIIHAHGGTITGENKQDGGANFSFSLPMA